MPLKEKVKKYYPPYEVLADYLAEVEQWEAEQAKMTAAERYEWEADQRLAYYLEEETDRLDALMEEEDE